MITVSAGKIGSATLICPSPFWLWAKAAAYARAWLGFSAKITVVITFPALCQKSRTNKKAPAKWPGLFEQTFIIYFIIVYFRQLGKLLCGYNKKITEASLSDFSGCNHDSGEIRTHDPRFRRPLLYPAELPNQFLNRTYSSIGKRNLYVNYFFEFFLILI